MTRADSMVWRAFNADPARRRRLIRRAAKEAVRLGLDGAYSYEVRGTGVLASCDGVPVAYVDAFSGQVAHD